MYLDTELEEKAAFLRLIRDYIQQRYCPHCQLETTMFIVTTMSRDFEESRYLLCLKCLHLYSEKLEEVTE